MCFTQCLRNKGGWSRKVVGHDSPSGFTIPKIIMINQNILISCPRANGAVLTKLYRSGWRDRCSFFYLFCCFMFFLLMVLPPHPPNFLPCYLWTRAVLCLLSPCCAKFPICFYKMGWNRSGSFRFSKTVLFGSSRPSPPKSFCPLKAPRSKDDVVTENFYPFWGVLVQIIHFEVFLGYLHMSSLQNVYIYSEIVSSICLELFWIF